MCMSVPVLPPPPPPLLADAPREEIDAVAESCPPGNSGVTWRDQAAIRFGERFKEQSRRRSSPVPPSARRRGRLPPDAEGTGRRRGARHGRGRGDEGMSGSDEAIVGSVAVERDGTGREPLRDFGLLVDFSTVFAFSSLWKSWRAAGRGERHCQSP